MNAFAWGLAAGAWLCWLATHGATWWGKRKARRRPPATTPPPANTVTLTIPPGTLDRQEGAVRWLTVQGVRFASADDLVAWITDEVRAGHIRADTSLGIAAAIGEASIEIDIKRMERGHRT